MYTAFQTIKKFENKLKNNFPLGTLSGSGQTAKLLLEIAFVGTTTVPRLLQVKHLQMNSQSRYSKFG